MTAPTSAERTGRIARLLEALDTQGYRVPAELLRHARYVPGWSVSNYGHGLYSVDGGGLAGAVLTRDDTLAHLRRAWVVEARANLNLPEPAVTDGITEAAKMETEPAFDDHDTPNRGPIGERSSQDHRAAMLRVVVAQQWAVAMAINNDPATWPIHAVEALMLPCADDVVADALGER